MTCEERQELIILYAADLLDPAQRDELAAHLASGCTTCAEALAEATIMLQEIPTTIDPVAPPPQAVGKLMQRVRSETASRPFAWRAMALAASIGIFIGAISIHLIEQTDRLKLLSALADSNRQLADIRQTFGSEQLKLVGLTAPDQSAAAGRVFWDREKNEWHVYVFNLKPPENGRTWELWYITPNQTKIRAGVFDTDASGRGSLVVQIPANLGPIAIAAITDEPQGGVDQPTGSVHLVGQVQ